MLGYHSINSSLANDSDSLDSEIQIIDDGNEVEEELPAKKTQENSINAHNCSAEGA